MGKLFDELKRRKVFRVAAVYAVVAWLLIQIAATVLPALQLPDWTVTFFTVTFILGFPIAVILAWAYEVTPEGIKSDTLVQLPKDASASTAQPINYIILAIVLLVAGFQVADRFVFESQANPAASAGLASERPLNSVQLPLRLENSYTKAGNPTYSHAISPNGEQIAYIGYDDYESHLYVKSPDSVTPRRIENSNGADNPFFSPDGESIAFFAQGKLKRVSVSGGNPVDIISINGSTRGGSWGEDNKIVYSQVSLMQVSAAGGASIQLTDLGPEEINHRLPHFIADGEAVIFQVISRDDGQVVNSVEIWVYDFRSNQSHFLIQGRRPQYTEGKLLFVRRIAGDLATLWSVDFDAIELAVVGAPVPIVGSMENQYAVSDNGILLYKLASRLEHARVLLRDNAGNVREQSENAPTGKARFSPDGKFLSMDLFVNGEQNIWVIELATDTRRQLTFGGGIVPIWSPTGDRIAYFKPGTGIVEQDLFSNDSPVVRIPSPLGYLPLHWTEHGLLYTKLNPSSDISYNIYFSSETGNTLPLNAELDGVRSTSGTISPDGNWVAFSSDESGRMEVYVKAFPPSGAARTPVSTTGGFHPKWSEDGSQLYFMSRTSLMVVDTEVGDEFSHGARRLVLDTGVEPTHYNDAYDIAPNQGGFVLVGDRFEKESVYVYVSNWQNLLLPN